MIYFTLAPKANLEMNKEGLAADLVCMLDERSLPRDKAKFEAQIAGFFIAGAARIDLIAKVINLDNDIGGYNFDIINLKETSNNIQSLSEIGGKNYYLIKLIELATESNYSIVTNIIHKNVCGSINYRDRVELNRAERVYLENIQF